MKPLRIALVALALTWGATAFAQSSGLYTCTPVPAPAAANLPPPGPSLIEETPATPGQPNLVTKVGVSTELGGGFGGFTDSVINDQTNLSGNWTARMTVGTRLHFGGELGYIGSAAGISTLGVDNKAYLLGNGIEGAARFNLLTGIWQPYAIAGIGWKHYTVQNTVLNTSDLATNSNVAEFPFGVGVAFRYAGLVLDTRFDINPATNSQLLPNTSLTTWDLAARAGFEF